MRHLAVHFLLLLAYLQHHPISVHLAGVAAKVTKAVWIWQKFKPNACTQQVPKWVKRVFSLQDSCNCLLNIKAVNQKEKKKCRLLEKMPVLEFIIALVSVKTLILRSSGHKNKRLPSPPSHSPPNPLPPLPPKEKKNPNKKDRIKKYYSSLLARKKQMRLNSLHLEVQKYSIPTKFLLMMVLFSYSYQSLLLQIQIDDSFRKILEEPGSGIHCMRCYIKTSIKQGCSSIRITKDFRRKIVGER